jgi:glycosyltransferase involved in cell wall biosynthesis
MKILVVSQYYYPEPFRINDICEEFVKRGNAVTVLTSLPNYPDGEIYKGYEDKTGGEVIKGVKVIRCKIRPRKKGSVNLLRNYISFWLSAYREVKKLDSDFELVYSYQLSPVSSVAPANWYARHYKVPHYLYCLDIWPESIVQNISSKSLLFKAISKYSKREYRGASRIGVTSPSFINYLERLTGKPHGVFSYIPQHALEMPLTNKENSDKLHILFTGNIGESQNLEVLIQAVESVRDKNGLKVTLVGSGSDYDRLVNLVSDKKLNDVITFTGRLPKSMMPEFYAKADFCFLSLRDEGAVSWTIPGKLQEYMSAGKPILAAINGDAKFVIEDAQCGVCVEFDDYQGLASKIEHFINYKSELLGFGQNARSYFEKNFTLQKHVDKLENELRELLMS